MIEKVNITDSNVVELIRGKLPIATEVKNGLKPSRDMRQEKRVSMTSGKSSVSCPLKPSDSAPLKHSTMPP